MFLPQLVGGGNVQEGIFWGFFYRQHPIILSFESKGEELYKTTLKIVVYFGKVVSADIKIRMSGSWNIVDFSG